MTFPQERREELRDAAEGHLRYGGGGDDLANGVLALLAALEQAEARIKAVEDVARAWENASVAPIVVALEVEPIMRAASARIRRALDGTVPPPAE